MSGKTVKTQKMSGKALDLRKSLKLFLREKSGQNRKNRGIDSLRKCRKKSLELKNGRTVGLKNDGKVR